MIFIGAIEYEGNKILYDKIKKILKLSDYKILYENKTKTIVFLSLKECNIALFNITPTSVSLLKELGIEFDILLHTFLGIVKENDNLLDLIKDSRYLVLNCDDENWSNLLGNEKSIVITYGFNSKATITLSSYYINEHIKGNICTQREIYPIYGDIVEPFELPIKINNKSKNHIYYILAAVACGLILGNSILTENLTQRFKL